MERVEKVIYLWDVTTDEERNEGLKILKLGRRYYARAYWGGWAGRCPNPHCPDPWGDLCCSDPPQIYVDFWSHYYKNYTNYYFPFWRVKLTRQLREKMKEIAPYIGRARIKYQK